MEQPKPVPDTRDCRDPQVLGMKLQELRAMFPDVPMSAIYDKHVRSMDVQSYDPQPPNHASVYQDELTARAAAGDRYAASLLNGKSLAEDPTD